MSNLEVPEARLHYETRGNGPLLLMVPGANRSASAFKVVAEYLAAQSTVLRYDWRGFSHSGEYARELLRGKNSVDA